MKRKIDLNDYIGTIYKQLQKGVLITSMADGAVNTMTISWGAIGIEWGKPIFTTYVRTGRKTHENLLKHGEFTVNIPLDNSAAKMLGFAGTHSGRNMDKINEMGVHLEEGETVYVPAIKELPLTLECKVVYRQTQDLEALKDEYRASCYPSDVPSTACGSNKDAHTAFYGEITAAYIIE